MKEYKKQKYLYFGYEKDNTCTYFYLFNINHGFYKHIFTDKTFNKGYLNMGMPYGHWCFYCEIYKYYL